MTVTTVVSGGQSGVDRAALDVALELGVACGGWCPKGRVAEDGRIAPHYPLRETPSETYAERTEWNVRDSDGTLILHRGLLSGGTAYTLEYARRLGKPHLVLDLGDDPEPSQVHQWAKGHGVGSMNVAGPRESTHPGIYAQASQFLRQVLGSRVRSGR